MLRVKNDMKTSFFLILTLKRLFFKDLFKKLT